VEVTQCLKDIIKGLSRFNELYDETIENFKISLQHLKNINMVKEGGFAAYKVLSPKELVEMVLQEVNHVIN